MEVFTYSSDAVVPVAAERSARRRQRKRRRPRPEAIAAHRHVADVDGADLVEGEIETQEEGEPAETKAAAAESDTGES